MIKYLYIGLLLEPLSVLLWRTQFNRYLYLEYFKWISSNLLWNYLFGYDVSFTVWDKVLFVSMDSSISDVVIKEESSISGVSFFSWEKWFLNL